MTLTLRATGPDDVGRVLAMEADPDTAPWLGESSPSWHADACGATDVEHLLALRDGEPVGFVVLAAPRGGETGTELRRIVVAPGHRGNGTGRMLLHAALARVPRGRVWLDVRPGNERALALYRSEGFVVERELPADPRDPGGPVALVVLARTV